MFGTTFPHSRRDRFAHIFTTRHTYHKTGLAPGLWLDRRRPSCTASPSLHSRETKRVQASRLRSQPNARNDMFGTTFPHSRRDRFAPSSQHATHVIRRGLPLALLRRNLSQPKTIRLPRSCRDGACHALFSKCTFGQKARTAPPTQYHALVLIIPRRGNKCTTAWYRWYQAVVFSPGGGLGSYPSPTFGALILLQCCRKTLHGLAKANASGLFVQNAKAVFRKSEPALVWKTHQSRHAKKWGSLYGFPTRVDGGTRTHDIQNHNLTL